MASRTNMDANDRAEVDEHAVFAHARNGWLAGDVYMPDANVCMRRFLQAVVVGVLVCSPLPVIFFSASLSHRADITMC